MRAADLTTRLLCLRFGPLLRRLRFNVDQARCLGRYKYSDRWIRLAIERPGHCLRCRAVLGKLRVMNELKCDGVVERSAIECLLLHMNLACWSKSLSDV